MVGLSGGERGCGRLAVAGWPVRLAGEVAACSSLLVPWASARRRQRLLQPPGGQQAGREGRGMATRGRERGEGAGGRGKGGAEGGEGRRSVRGRGKGGGRRSGEKERGEE